MLETLLSDLRFGNMAIEGENKSLKYWGGKIKSRKYS